MQLKWVEAVSKLFGAGLRLRQRLTVGAPDPTETRLVPPWLGPETSHNQVLKLLLVICVCGFMATAGCNALNKRPQMLSFKDQKPTTKKTGSSVPHSMAVVWKDAIYTQPGKSPTRGFGGRIYFYNEKNEAVRVDGELTVYAYNDERQVQDSKRAQVPDRKFVFTADLFDRHHSETELGHSYSVWIPWDAAGGEATSISLIPVFRSQEGGIVKGGYTLNVLPGKSSQSTEGLVGQNASRGNDPAGWSSSIRPVTYQSTREPANSPPADAVDAPSDTSTPRMSTSTIKLSPSLSRQLLSPQANARPNPQPVPLTGASAGATNGPANQAYSRTRITYGDRPCESYTEIAKSQMLDHNGPAVFGSPGPLPGQPVRGFVAGMGTQHPWMAQRWANPGSPSIRFEHLKPPAQASRPAPVNPGDVPNQPHLVGSPYVPPSLR